MVQIVYLAKPRGFCAGVVMAIEAVEKAADEMKDAHQGDLAVYHAIVHNDTVVRRLEQGHGVHFVEDLDEMKGLEERARADGGSLADTVVFSAHGVSPAVRGRADALGPPGTFRPEAGRRRPRRRPRPGSRDPPHGDTRRVRRS